MFFSALQFDRVVLGALGCGVFGQTSEEVAEIFRLELQNAGWIKNISVVFAIPGGNGNLEAFRKELL